MTNVKRVPDDLWIDPETLDIERTMANLFGCQEYDVPRLIQLSDLAANVKYDLEDGNISDVFKTLDFIDAVEKYGLWMWIVEKAEIA